MSSTSRRKRVNLEVKKLTLKTIKDSTNEPEQCVVCLDVITSRGIIPVCDHTFCYTCIYEWSKNTNTCPLCKKRFRCITKMSPHTPPRKVRVTDKDQSEHLNDESSLLIEEFTEEEEEESDSLNGFIVSDDSYIPSSYDDSEYDHTHLQSTPARNESPWQQPAPSFNESPQTSWQQPAPSSNESSDDDLITRPRTIKRIVSSPETAPSFNESPLQSSDGILIKSSGWISSRRPLACNNKRQRTRKQIVKKKRKRISWNKNNNLRDFISSSEEDSDWTISAKHLL